LADLNFNNKSVTFLTGSAVLSKQAAVELDKLYAILNERPNVAINIEGHTDNTGRPETNKTLSQKRADAVKAYLVKKGIAEDRMTATGFGPEKPVADNKTAAGRAENRRVEFSLR
jgi:outer membrane protein OmpA-like peptidoglycan-associated protein